MPKRILCLVSTASVVAALVGCGRSTPNANTRTQRPEASAAADSSDPAEVVRRYYAAIAAKDYRRAYELWGNAGAASGQTYAQFVNGFAQTASVHVEIGPLGRIEGAAGSRYVDVPVTIEATTNAGRHQRFEGTYTLRRTVIEGSTPAQRRWHIDSAHIVRAS